MINLTTIMMWFLILLLPYPTAATVLTTSTVKFINHCPYPLYFWRVLQSAKGPIDEKDGSERIVPPNGGSSYHRIVNTEVETAGQGGAMALKIRDVPYYATAPAGIMQAEYHYEPSKGKTWYDLSALDCAGTAEPEDPTYCPFLKGGIKMWVPGYDSQSCKTASCLGGNCVNAYPPRDLGTWANMEPSWGCVLGCDVVIETCFDNPGAQTNLYGDGWKPGDDYDDEPRPIPDYPTEPEPSLPEDPTTDYPVQEDSPPIYFPNSENNHHDEPTSSPYSYPPEDCDPPSSPSSYDVYCDSASTCLNHRPSIPSINDCVRCHYPWSAPYYCDQPLSYYPADSICHRKTYPVPSNIPDSTLCFDDQCDCYAVVEHHTYPREYPMQSACPGGPMWDPPELGWNTVECKKWGRCPWKEWGNSWKRELRWGRRGSNGTEEV